MILDCKGSMGRNFLLLWVALAIGLCYITYNFNTIFLDHNQPTQIIEPTVNKYGSAQNIPMTRIPKNREQLRNPNPKFHVAVTATDSTYSKWQCRIMYYWYKRFKDLPGSDMGGFTRVLHSGFPDSLMHEIPSFVVNPLPDDKGYIVLNRPYAFLKWIDKATIEEEYIFVNPLPNLAYGANPAAYPFFYIEPTENEKIVRKFYTEGPISNVDPIGSSPVIIKKSLLKEIVPTWMNISWRIKYDPEADQTFGWVQEMYAYAIASALHGVKHNLFEDFMLQPPRDEEVEKRYIIHYTYPCDYNMKGELTYGQIGEWSFNKRLYDESPPPKNLTLPPPGAPNSVIHTSEFLVTLVKMVNEASSNIPGWENP